MRKKKLTALALTLALAAGLGMPALAADPTNDPTPAPASSSTASLTTSTGNASTTTTVTGTIRATQLRVTVPTSIAFDIDPTITATGPSSQITAQSSGITVTNQSIVPIWVRVTNVAVTMDSAGTGVTNGSAPKLVNAWPASETAAAGGARNLMFALKADDAKPTNFTTPSNWLVGSNTSTGAGSVTGNYFISSTGKLDATGVSTSSISLKIYGQTGKNWQAGEKFTITPTLTVSVKDPAKF